MINTTQNFIKRNRYKLSMFGLMLSASVICVLLVAARITYSDTGRYTGLVWNLFLAWIPFVLAYLAYALSWKKPLLYFVLPFTAFLWLLFFPNAPYILTDLQHLAKETSGAPVWYDVIVMVWFSWTGLLLGLVSLYLMHDIVQRTFGRWFGWAFVLFVSGLSSFGVYLGRFVRFNSWDLLDDPTEIVVTILGLAIDPSKRLVAFTILFAAFYLFVYLTLYSFAHLLQEQNVSVK
ncbi:MAG: DUF1361 domain-containing protein [Anaerolineales bacterium]|uniref:DUF1361 domain-containing protein n=1 Tax=Candidatus Villigracilis proximus TaxID=3140683 RepID=UPI003136F5EC|nr:DUF1361 domain-containing protein [Anaerolineales bacterium]MBK8821426.1 DUF1361 domain-containing protein [Anaerolineales bacterium]MBK9209167.1 DUF1361 domain-containing protein [Anaerolineales bacterium]